MAKGHLTHDLTVGPAHDVQLKKDQEVQILKDSGSVAVIMVQLPDGSNGVYQIASTDVEIAAPSPGSAPAIAPAPANPTPAAVVPAPSAPSPPAATVAPVAPASPPLAPTYPDDFVGGPEFVTTAGEQAAGTASVVKLKDGTQSYIVSARHLLGPEGGFKTQTAASDVPTFVKSIRIKSFAGGERDYDVTGLLVPTKRLKADGGEPMDDMAVYQNNDSAAQSQAGVLTDKVPAVGEPVWCIARVRGGVPEGQIIQSGVVKSNEKWIVFQFDNDKIITAGASGAPVLNAAGEVVGVYSGHSQRDGHMLGFVIPAPLIATVIKQVSK
jgi:hypothetical protein